MTSARDLATRREVARAFVDSSSARVIGAFLMLAVVLRAAMGGLIWGDLVAVAVVVVLLGPVEWVIHRMLLHAQPTNRVAELLGTRDSHERHHRVPDDLDWLLLRRPNAIGSCLAIVLPLGSDCPGTRGASAHLARGCSGEPRRRRRLLASSHWPTMSGSTCSCTPSTGRPRGTTPISIAIIGCTTSATSDTGSGSPWTLATDWRGRCRSIVMRFR